MNKSFGSFSACDQAIEILRLTHDGDDLDPIQLKLVENAVNGFLNDKGIEVFDKLYTTVIEGKYKKPSFHGFDNLTIDHIGYVYWKGNIVEHYNLSWAYSEEAKKEAQDLAWRCKIVEERNEIPSTHNVIWEWPENKEFLCTQ